MAPKKEKGPKQVLAISQLTSFLSMYKGACKRCGTTPDATLLDNAEKKLQDYKPLEKILLSGPHHGSSALIAVLDAMAGYAPIKTFACWGCNIGDEGLLALSQLIRASAHCTWIGSKPIQIEIVYDGAEIPPDRWPERYLHAVNGEGGSVTRGPGFALPSLALGQAQGVTLDTMRLQPEGAEAGAGAGTDLASLERQLSNLLASTSTATTTMLYDQITTARAATDAAAAAAASPAAAAAAAAAAAVHPGTGRPMLRPPPPQAWSSPVLGALALALGTQGHRIQVLSLDHNQLGDAGAKLLAAGLKRCAPLQQLSLSHCGFGPEGAAALAASLPPDPNPHLAALQPKYKYLNLSYNPLCAAGVAALAGGLAGVGSLKVLLLAGVELGSEAADLQALAALAACLAANTSITQVDLDGNHIGDAGASELLPFLQSQKHLRKLRLSPRLSRPLLAAVTEAVRANLAAPKKKLRKKKKAGAGAK